jgi:hypothetical protein
MTAILDGHIHLVGNDMDRGALLAELGVAGASGGALISQPPASFDRIGVLGARPPEARLRQVLDRCAPGTDLYPLFWIDPLAPDHWEVPPSSPAFRGNGGHAGGGTVGLSLAGYLYS